MPRAWTTYPTSGVLAGGGGTPTVTGANVAEVLAGLAAYTGAGLAIARVSGQAPRLMAYDADDDAWYGTDGGDGSELAPYWTALTGDDGVAALPAPTSGVYGVVGKGSGSPGALRGLVLVAASWATGESLTAGVLLPEIVEWVSPTLHALGTPSTCYVASRTTSPWTPSVGSGGNVDYNSTVASRVAVRSGTAANSTMSVGTRSTSSVLAALATRLKAAGVSTASGVSSFARTMSTTDTNQYSGLSCGGTLASNATEWHTWGSAGAPVPTGVALAAEKRIETVLVLSSNAFSMRVDGASSAAFSTTSIATTAATAGAEVTAAPQGGAAVTLSFERLYLMEWD